jgi:hypothetical protein
MTVPAQTQGLALNKTFSALPPPSDRGLSTPVGALYPDERLPVRSVLVPVRAAPRAPPCELLDARLRIP